MSGTLPWCESCDEPLVTTFIIPYKEFYCLSCGRAWAWFHEPRKVVTEARTERAKAIAAEFAEIVDGYIVPRSKHADCEGCKQEDHLSHATEEQLQASREAWDRLIARSDQIAA